MPGTQTLESGAFWHVNNDMSQKHVPQKGGGKWKRDQKSLISPSKLLHERLKAESDHRIQ